MGLMLQTGLDFAPGTTEECKKLVVGLFTPSEIFGAYRMARSQLKTSDLVLLVSKQDPSEFQAEPRSVYVKRLREVQGSKQKKGVPILMRGLAEKSAHAVMKLPAESDALWLLVVRGPKEVPVMCVLYATPYEAEPN
jgi:hypothetical protein